MEAGVGMRRHVSVVTYALLFLGDLKINCHLCYLVIFLKLLCVKGFGFLVLCLFVDVSCLGVYIFCLIFF